MRRDRRGVALLFDALAFLTIITVVAVAMMQLVRFDRSADDTDTFVEEVHRAVLSTTFSVGGEASPMSLLDALRASYSSGNSSLQREAMDQIDGLLSGYLEPEHRYLWTVEHDGVAMSVGWDGITSEKASLYISHIESKAPGSDMTLTLTVAH